jgi:DNA invertase Pin-like site-specific DNA recombinase
MVNILYLRISTNKQNLIGQEKLSEIYLKEKNIKIDYIFKEIGSAFKNKQNKLLYILNNYQDSNIYILNISRFSRNIVNGVYYLELANKLNNKIYFLEEELTTSNFCHKHLIRIEISKYQYESEGKSNYFKSKNEFEDEIEYGYKILVKNNKRYTLENKEEKKIIEFINCAKKNLSIRCINLKLKKINSMNVGLDFYDKSNNITRLKKELSFSSIAKILNENNILYRNKKWKPHYVKKIFKN